MNIQGVFQIRKITRIPLAQKKIPMSRIMIIGCGGSGKSTFAQKLHALSGIRLIHLDKHFWKPNWVESDKVEWQEKVEELSDAESWIIDGNYGGTMDIRFNKADIVIFLDRSRWLCLYRVIKRVVINYGRRRKDMAEGCKERFSWAFMKYVYQYNETRKPRIIDKLNQLKDTKEVIILNNNREVKNYLKRLNHFKI